MLNVKIRQLLNSDRRQALQFITERWGAEIFIVHNTIYKPVDFPGFIAFNEDSEDKWLGLVTYYIQGDDCEIITIDSAVPTVGVGTALLKAVKQTAINAQCVRLWLITTNDNLDALRFYQRRGFTLVAVHNEAVNKARKLKPEIPAIGDYGIPLRDEIELEMRLATNAASGKVME